MGLFNGFDDLDWDVLKVVVGEEYSGMFYEMYVGYD